MSIKPVGGRGLKAPYATVTMRIPKPLADYFNKIIKDYRTEILTQTSVNTENIIDRDIKITKLEAIENATKILKHKKNARYSLEKLLQVLYEDKNIKL